MRRGKRRWPRASPVRAVLLLAPSPAPPRVGGQQGTPRDRAQEQLRSGKGKVMTLEMLLCPTCASVSPAEGTSA